MVSWLDSAGNFWLFGGYGNDAIGNEGVLNDLWRYSPGANVWTWMSGSTMQGAAGIYGTQGTRARQYRRCATICIILDRWRRQFVVVRQ